MTTDRTIAEIVWSITSRPCTNRTDPERLATEMGKDCEKIDCRVWSSDVLGRTEYDLSEFGNPTVDDIRDWLQTQDVSVWAGENRDTPLLVNGDWVFLDVIQNNLDHPNCTNIKSETMLGALESVVRLLSI